MVRRARRMVRRLVRGSSMGSGWGFLGSFSALGSSLAAFFWAVLRAGAFFWADFFCSCFCSSVSASSSAAERMSRYLNLLQAAIKGVGGLALPHADHRHARLPQAGGQAGEVAVAGHQYEAVHLAGVEDVHGVDDHAESVAFLPVV